MAKIDAMTPRAIPLTANCFPGRKGNSIGYENACEPVQELYGSRQGKDCEELIKISESIQKTIRSRNS
jgi:hypothetical protein